MEVRLGYKQTEVGVIPEGWGVCRLGDIAEISAGGTPSRTNPNYWDGEIPWVTTSEVDFSVINNAGQSITSEGLKNSAAKLIRSGTLLMALYGQGKTRGKVAMLGIEAATNQACAAISLRNIASNNFIFHYLVSQYEAIRGLSNTGNQENLNSSLVRSICVPFPDPEEQHTIATALSDVDAMLDGLDRLIAKKRAIKQATMQQLLTGQTRLPGFSGEWEVTRLGDCVSIRNQKVLPANVAPETLCVELEHVGQGDGRLLIRGEARNSSAAKYRFQVGDILFGRLRSYLRKYWLATEEGICTTEIWPLMFDLERIKSGFLFALVQTDNFIEAASISYGTHMPRADWNVVRNHEIHLPSKEEQTAIATILSDMDTEITALETRRTKTRALKRAMMQELLTGRTRLV